MKNIALKWQMDFMEQMTDENKHFHEQNMSRSICQACHDHFALDVELYIDD